MDLRRPEWTRSTIARRPARMLSSPRSRGRASVRHSRAVSTPPVRSVHPMDPIGSVGRGWLMGLLRSVVSQSGDAQLARLRNAAGTEIAKRSFQAGGTGIWGSFFFRIDVPGVPNRPRGTLEVFEESAEDGSEIFKRVVPILFGRALQDPYQGFAVYTVRSGDTLSSIAQQFYGDPDRFRTIFQANRNVLDDPDEIFPGQELRIPQ